MNILLRGDICRGCSIAIQNETCKSIITHVIKPLNISCKDINVIIVTFNKDYEKYAKDIFKDYNLFFLTIDRDHSQVTNYINSLNIIIPILRKENKNLIILRNDLYFKRDIDYSRISKDKILMQWNLLHQKSTGEMADQIQFIGGNLIPYFINRINTIKIDTKWPNTLHNFYNYCIEHFGKEKISYLNYIEDPAPNNDICEIRGWNGGSGGRFLPDSALENELGNPLYTYTRHEAETREKLGD